MYDNAKAIGETVRELRRKRGLSQTLLADLAGVTRSHLSDIENGRKSPNIATLWRIAEALTIKTSTLIQMAEEKIKPP